MKFLIILFVTFLACASAAVYQRNVVMPVAEIEGRITNGNTASVGQFPYQVGLSLQLNALSSSWCGGSLIASNWVLTAAHCTIGAKKATVYLGATERTSAEVTYTVSASDIIIHAAYNDATLKNDISLIKIPSVSYTAKIQPVKLPAMASSYATYTGDYVIASGWGRISDNIPSVTKNLQWARFKVISNTQCAAYYVKNTVTATNICISTPGATSTCSGDSGGPLVLESTKVQIGLTSFGADSGCELGVPAAFTRLTSYLDWIKANTGIAY